MGGVIKAGDPTGRTLGAQGVAFNLLDVREQAGAVLQQAQQQAKQIIADAEKKAAEIQQRATGEGKAAAEKAARVVAQKEADAKLQAQLKTILPALQQLVNELAQERTQWRARWETEAIDLAAAIAERVVRQEIEQRPEITLTLLKEALELASASGQLQVRMNPADHAALGAEAETLVASLRPAAQAQVVADAAVRPGGCVVKTDHGAIDQQIETQIARIREDLQG